MRIWSGRRRRSFANFGKRPEWLGSAWHCIERRVIRVARRETIKIVSLLD